MTWMVYSLCKYCMSFIFDLILISDTNILSSIRLFESLANPLPVIPVADAPSFFSSIQEYMANLDDIPVDSPTLGDSIVLLSCATTGYPGALCEQTTNILSDLFPSFRTLSQATHTSEGRGLLGDYLGEQTAENIIRFWQKDISME
ncbi:hypothetical protein BJX99DRAFT_223260 [Aspergillus californicus]